MSKKAILFSVIALLLALAASLIWVRPPGPGNVYSISADTYRRYKDTALLVRNGECLTLSISPEDIGRTNAPPGSENRMFALGTAQSVVSGTDSRGMFLEDRNTGLKARVGQAIDGEIYPLAPRSLQENWWKHSMAAGWPISDECGHSLAVISSIEKVRNSNE